MEHVKQHLVAVWASETLECRAVGVDYIHAYTGPSFPIGAFCADVADKFDAEVESRVDANGLRLIITVKDMPAIRNKWGCRGLLWAAALVCPAVAYFLTTREVLRW